MDIVKVIKGHNWTANAVAYQLGVHPVSFSKTIHGNPTVSTLSRIADIIGCDVMEFFKDEAKYQTESGEIVALVNEGGKFIPMYSIEDLREFINNHSNEQ